MFLRKVKITTFFLLPCHLNDFQIFACARRFDCKRLLNENVRVASLNKMSAPIDLDNLFVREVERKNESFLKIYQSGVGDVGCVVWDAALVLLKYLETADFNNGQHLEGKSVIELGAGTGAVGLLAATYGYDLNMASLSGDTKM